MKKVIIFFACLLLASYCEAQSSDKTGSKVDTLLIKKNDNRFFEAEYDLENNLKFEEVATMLDSSKTLSIQVTFSDGAGTMLRIFNPFSEQLIYIAELYSYKKKDYLKTSTVPVFPKLISIETWPYKIDQLRLTGFKLIKE